jgi:hypothetical protein
MANMPSIPKDATTYILKVNDGDKSLFRILEALQDLGSRGSSRSVDIEDVGKFGFDGDGADKIYNIEIVESSEITAQDNKNRYRKFINKAR